MKEKSIFEISQQTKKMGCLKLAYRRNYTALKVVYRKYASYENNRAGAYRYGFNGQEKDDEVKGSGNSYDFGARIYDPRLGRWLSLDPLMTKYPHLSPYNFVGNEPILHLDPDGKEIWIAFQWKDNKGNSQIEKVQYKNGELYGTNGKKYATNNVYFNAVKDHLNTLKTDDNDTKVIVDYMETNKEVNIITNDDLARPNSKSIGNYNREADPNEAPSTKSSVTKFDNSEYNVNKAKRNPRVSLIHELKHGFDRNLGTLAGKNTTVVDGIKRSEIDAVKIENKSRVKTGDSQRNTYGGKVIKEIKP